MGSLGGNSGHLHSESMFYIISSTKLCGGFLDEEGVSACTTGGLVEGCVWVGEGMVSCWVGSAWVGCGSLGSTWVVSGSWGSVWVCGCWGDEGWLIIGSGCMDKMKGSVVRGVGEGVKGRFGVGDGEKGEEVGLS